MRLRNLFLGLAASLIAAGTGLANPVPVNLTLTFDESGNLTLSKGSTVLESTSLKALNGGLASLNSTFTGTGGATAQFGQFDTMGGGVANTIEYSLSGYNFTADSGSFGSRSEVILTEPNGVVSDVIVFESNLIFVYNQDKNGSPANTPDTDKYDLANNYIPPTLDGTATPGLNPSGNAINPNTGIGMAEQLLLQNTVTGEVPVWFSNYIIGTENSTTALQYGNATVGTPSGPTHLVNGKQYDTQVTSDGSSSGITFSSNGYFNQFTATTTNTPGFLNNGSVTEPVGSVAIDFVDGVPLPNSAASLSVLLGLVGAFVGCNAMKRRTTAVA